MALALCPHCLPDCYPPSLVVVEDGQALGLLALLVSVKELLADLLPKAQVVAAPAPLPPILPRLSPPVLLSTAGQVSL